MLRRFTCTLGAAVMFAVLSSVINSAVVLAQVVDQETRAAVPFNQVPSSRLAHLRHGIGTAHPQATLDVRGDVLLVSGLIKVDRKSQTIISILLNKSAPLARGGVHFSLFNSGGTRSNDR